MDIRYDVGEKLSELLRDGIDVHRCAAAAALGRIGGSVDVLIAALLDEDPDVRTDAAAALAENPDPSAAEQLMQNLLGDPCTEVKEAAIRTLTALRHPPAIPWLRRLAVSRDPEVAWDEEKFHDSGWDDWVDIQALAIESLGLLAAEESVDDIVSVLDDEMGQDLTDIALGALARLGEAGAAAMIQILDSKDLRRRQMALKYLAKVNIPSARSALAGALGDTSPEMRLVAARGLAAWDSADPRLTALFDDSNPGLRAEAVTLCGRDHPDRLEALLSDSSEEVRRAVLAVIRDVPRCLNAERIAPKLTDMLLAGTPEIAALAAAALAAVAPATAFEALTLVAMNQQGVTDARLGALKALAGLDDRRQIEIFATLAADAERDIRYQALVALARLAGRDGVDTALAALIAALRGELLSNPEADAETIERDATDGADTPAETEDVTSAEPEAEQAETPAPTSTLESILGGTSPRLRAVQRTSAKVELSGRDLEFLGLARRKMGKKKVDPAPKIAPYLDIRRFAARVAGDVARPEMAAALSEHLSAEDPELALAALDSLARIAAQLRTLPLPIVDELAAKVLEKNSPTRLLALRALGATDAPRAQAALRVCLGDADSFLRTESLRALSARGALEPDQVERLLKDSDPGVRLAAAQAVGQTAHNGNCATLVEFAFAFEGYHHREVAKILRDLAPQDASRHMLEVLDEPERRREWQVAIEVLAALNEPNRPA